MIGRIYPSFRNECIWICEISIVMQDRLLPHLPLLAAEALKSQAEQIEENILNGSIQIGEFGEFASWIGDNSSNS